MSNVLFIFQNSSWSTPQLQHDASSLPKALQAREGTELILCVCMHPQENLIPTAAEHAAHRMYHSTTASKLWWSTQNTNPRETSQSRRSQINNLIKTTSSSVFLLIFNILCINSTGFFSWKNKTHIENIFPNGTAPLLTIKKTKTTKMRIQVLIYREQNSPWV